MATDLTLLFTDIEGSTAVNARLGDAAMSTLWALALCNLGHVLAAAGKVHEARSALLEAQGMAHDARDTRLADECQAALDALPPEAVVEATHLQFSRD